MEFSAPDRARRGVFSTSTWPRVEPDARLAAGGAGAADRPGLSGRRQAAASGLLIVDRLAAIVRRQEPAAARRRASAKAPDSDNQTPQALADARAASRCATVRSTAQVRDVRTPDRAAEHGSRAPTIWARRHRHRRRSSIDPMQAELCGISLALAPNEACYVPLAIARRRRQRAVRRRPRTRSDRRSATRSLRSSRCSRTRRAQDRAHIKFDTLHVRAARHRDRADRRHHADVLRARCRARGPRHRRSARERWLGHTPIALRRRRRHRQDAADLRPVSIEQGRRVRRRGRRRRRCGCGMC